jgi:hypothetical protein
MKISRHSLVGLKLLYKGNQNDLEIKSVKIEALYPNCFNGPYNPYNGLKQSCTNFVHFFQNIFIP